jgi:hypothetical protein
MNYNFLLKINIFNYFTFCLKKITILFILNLKLLNLNKNLLANSFFQIFVHTLTLLLGFAWN